MGGWFWLIALGLFLVLIGLYLHWSVILLGALLPFVPVVAELLRRRRARSAPPAVPSMTPAYACNQTDYPGSGRVAKLATPAVNHCKSIPMDPTGQMVLANRLADGQVVFLTTDGSWVEDIALGALVRDPAAAQRLLADAQLAESRNVVVEPYLIDIRDEAGHRQPVSFREAIRATGPTVRTDLED